MAKNLPKQPKRRKSKNLHIITSNFLKYLWNPVAIVDTFGYQFENYVEPQIDNTVTLSKVKEKKLGVGKQIENNLIIFLGW